ncbi:amino acid adenylation domain-containing protein [Photorhabdus tasmaniensis]|uniref:amino acid adenylation domain-containing protein n=1 Tax=Photorhabdus tasmaniensis TaxID=1004159 RepID=UPI00404136D9
MMNLRDREFWLEKMTEIAVATAATSEIFQNGEKQIINVVYPLKERVAANFKQVTSNSELLSWAVLAASMAIVLRRFGITSSVVFHTDLANGKSLPVLLHVPPTATFREWLNEVRLNCSAVLSHHSVESGILEKYQDGYPIVVIGNQIEAEGLVLQIGDSELRAEATGMTRYFLDILLSGISEVIENGFNQPDIKVCNISVVNAHLSSMLLKEFNFPSKPVKEKSFLERVLHIAHKEPDALAIWDDNDTVNYREMVNISVSIALILKGLNVNPNDVIAISAPRNVGFIIVATGILFSGAAYLPVDPALPSTRKKQMLKYAKVFISDEPEELSELINISFSGLILKQEWHHSAIDTYSIQQLMRCIPESDDLAYIIFTSGSTGNPKGVGIEHHSFLSLLSFRVQNCNLRVGVPIPQTAPVSFDISVWQMFAGLTAGATLCVVPDNIMKDPVVLIDRIITQRFEYIELVPSLISIIIDIVESEPQLKPLIQRYLRGLIATGEVLSTDLAHRWNRCLPDITLLNAYGPAECTDDVTQGIVSNNLDGLFCPVGSPLPNVMIYVLDDDLQLLPPMIVGEIYIGGSNVGRGYIGEPGLTAAAFIPDPYHQQLGSRMYRTGDRGRWRLDGTLECLGRTDNQVKIRGRRVELGEIESLLTSRSDVAMCAVELVNTDGFERLVAFVTPVLGANLIADKLKLFLAGELPAFMIPARYEILTALPCNQNGKIDRKQLRALANVPQEEDNYISPRNETEEILCKLWCKYLKLPRVGIADDFFALGGDSILGIRLAHEASSMGIMLRPRHLFEYPTIQALVNVLDKKRTVMIAEPDLVRGPLTPIQRWFFAQQFAAPHHWNQSYVLKAKNRLDAHILSLALNTIMEHHDQLRVYFPFENGERVQCIGSVRENILWQHDLSSSIESIANKAHASLSLEGGPLIRAVLLNENQLLLTLHHLIVDQFSWQILLEDLERVYLSYIKEIKPSLPSKTIQYLRWSQRQHQQTVKTVIPLISSEGINAITVNRAIANLYGKRAVNELILSEEETQRIVSCAAHMSNRGMPAALLSGVAKVVASKYGEGYLLIEFESHGREEAEGIADVSRTIGWFTTFGPLELPVSDDITIADVTKVIIESNPQISAYLNQTHCIQKAPQISFNYLGRITEDDNIESYFSIEEDIGLRRAAQSHRPLEWEINAGIVNRRLILTIEYVPGRHILGEIDRFLSAWREALSEIASEPIELNDLAPLTPAQLAFFERSIPNYNHYNHGVLFTFGRQITLAAAESALAQLQTRHPVLGTGFISTRRGKWQGILPENKIHIVEYDLQMLSIEELSETLNKLANAGHESLDVVNGPIARAHLYRMPASAFDQLLLIVHHLVVDPYSWEILTVDFTHLLDRKILPGEVTTPYFKWARRLHQLVQNDPESLGCQYWLSQDFNYVQHLIEVNTPCEEENMVEVTTIFDSNWTKAFLHVNGKDQHPAIRLLALLARVIEWWLPAEQDDILIELGGHGREDIFEDIELGNTVGWFTSSYPFKLPFSKGRDFDEHTREIAKRLAEIPVRGFGYEALRYLSANTDISDKLCSIQRPQLRFDFEGELSFLNSQHEENTTIINVTTSNTGQWKTAGSPLAYLLCYNIYVNDGCMEIRSQFAGEVFTRERIDALVLAYKRELILTNSEEL